MTLDDRLPTEDETGRSPEDDLPRATEPAADEVAWGAELEAFDALLPPAEEPDPVAIADRASDLRLARLHLRLGGLTLARAELEAAHGAAALAGDALLDLAEARWRTGDLAGAGAAAEAILADDAAALAMVIAAEAAMADGRPTDARPWMLAALERAGEGLDALFAGMPRSDIWPPDRAAPVGTGDAGAERPTRVAGAAGSRGLAQPALPESAHRSRSTLEVHGSDSRASRPASMSRPALVSDPAAELAAADAEIDAGESAAAMIRLALVLRLTPALAPAVLERLDAVSGPAAALVRGDALRLVGRTAEADRSWAAAAAAIEGRYPEPPERGAQPGTEPAAIDATAGDAHASPVSPDQPGTQEEPS